MERALIAVIVSVVPVFFVAVFVSSTYHRLRSLRSRIPSEEVAESMEHYHGVLGRWLEQGIGSAEAVATLRSILASAAVALSRFRREPFSPEAVAELDRERVKLDVALEDLLRGNPAEGEVLAIERERMGRVVNDYNEQVSAYASARGRMPTAIVAALFGFGPVGLLQGVRRESGG